MSAERAERLATVLAERDLDALVVTNIVNVRYLTGFTGTNAVAIAGAERREFLTDFRYVSQAAEQVTGFEPLRGKQDLLGDVVERLVDAGARRVGFEDQHLSVRQHRRLSELAGGAFELMPAGGLVERLRAVKEEAEVRAIAEAAKLADTVFTDLADQGLAGRTERELALYAEEQLRRRGAEGVSFPSIIAGGAHGALPHAEPREVEVRAGDLVVLDLGCVLDGYCSDCTRTLAAGEPGDEAREVYELVRRAQAAALDAVRPGADVKAVDAVARDMIADAGHGERFGHGLGHGVGLEIHEAPRVAQRSPDGTLAAGNVVTVEPGVYLPGRFGVRIEDLVVVRDGGPEILTGFTKELVIAG